MDPSLTYPQALPRFLCLSFNCFFKNHVISNVYPLILYHLLLFVFELYKNGIILGLMV